MLVLQIHVEKNIFYEVKYSKHLTTPSQVNKLMPLKFSQTFVHQMLPRNPKADCSHKITVSQHQKLSPTAMVSVHLRA